MDLENLDAFEREYIFSMWPGMDPITPDRVTEIFSIVTNTHSPVVFLNGETYEKWELPSAPFHPAIKYISECHMSDYLRVYLMQHYGGGYTDIKFAYKPWDEAFARLKNSDALGLGYALGSHTQIGMSPLFDGKPEYEIYKAHATESIGHVAFIFKRNTEMTRELYERTHALLDTKHELLKENPATHQKDKTGRELPDGSVSKYPLHYVEMGADLFIPVMHKYRHRLLQHDIEPLHAYHFDLQIPGFEESKKDFLRRHLPIYPAG
jgi:hypothetical protein